MRGAQQLADAFTYPGEHKFPALLFHRQVAAQQEGDERGAEVTYACQIDDEVRRFVDEAYSDALRLLTDNWDRVDRVAQALLKHETLSSDEVGKLLRGEALSKPTVADLLAAEAAKKEPPATPRPPRADESPEPPPGAFPSPA